MKIGILYPRSNVYPGMMMDFIDAVKASLKQCQLTDKTTLHSESIGLGGNEKEVYEKTEKLLVLEGVDILVAYVDLRVLDILKPLLYTSGKLVLIVNPGANYPQNWVPQPNILYLTLQHGFLCWLTGKLATQMNKTNAAMATSFYDCGYLHTAAMVKRFVQSGGSITYNYVNNQLYDDMFEIKTLTDHLSVDLEIDSLLCVFDSIPASLFYQRLNNFQKESELHLFVSPMMLEKKALENTRDGFQFSINGYLPWHESLDNKNNQIFQDAYKQTTNREANVFSLLGWETALIAQQVHLLAQENYADGTGIAEQLAEIKISSPRGEMKLDKDTHYFTAPVYKATLNNNSSEMIIENMGNSENDWADFTEHPSEGVSSGWTNTYLCY